MAATYYILDTSGRLTYTTTITVSPPAYSNATHTLQYWSVDSANNTETAHIATFTVGAPPDTTPPTTKSDIPTNPPVYSAVSTITLTATDNAGGWGVATTYYILDNGGQIIEHEPGHDAEHRRARHPHPPVLVGRPGRQQGNDQHRDLHRSRRVT